MNYKLTGNTEERNMFNEDAVGKIQTPEEKELIIFNR